MNTDNKKVVIITGDKLWMEGNAINQAHEVAKLDGVQRVVAMPDLHVGKTPVGVVTVTAGRIYPHLIGTDIGCGMSIFSTGIETKKVKIDRWVSRLNTIKTLSVVPNSEHHFDDRLSRESRELACMTEAIEGASRQAYCPIPDFGSIGSGNHFAEFQAIHEVFDEEAVARLKMDKSKLLITVHSGSRSYGSKILQQFNEYKGFAADSKEAKEYMRLHHDALRWASLNRHEVAKKLLDYLGFTQVVESKLECDHNFLEESGGLFYHRKGVVSAKADAVLIAGSRGTLSYIVRPTATCAEYGYSLAHGSGRKWARSMCKGRIREKYTLETIRRNKFGGQLVCHDYDLLFEEAPDVYKNVDSIIAILEVYGMIEKIATLKPVLTFKG